MTGRIVIVLLFALSQPHVIAEDTPSKPLAYTVEERELLELVSDLQTKEDAFYSQMAKITDVAERTTYYTNYTKNDPAREAIPKLLAFEERHRGTYPGLMALRWIVKLAANLGEPGSVRYLGRQAALKRLPVYASRIEIAEILRRDVDDGNFELQTEQLFRTLFQSREADATVREFSKLMLARWLLGLKRGRENLERRVQGLDKGAESEFPTERQSYVERLSPLPTAAQMQGWDKESVNLLRDVVNSSQDLRQPAVQSVDPQRCLIRLDVERTKTMPRLSELADAMLFKELYLQIGKAAPDFKVRLVSGEDWALSGQKGKVVIIQFSFKGCGPCERMYPDLQEIQKQYGPKVSILSIMADEKQSVTEEAVKSGKLTWDVHWDGMRGPLATRWGVYYHPTVYVLDSKGFIADHELRGKQVKQKVAELVKLAETPQEPLKK